MFSAASVTIGGPVVFRFLNVTLTFSFSFSADVHGFTPGTYYAYGVFVVVSYGCCCSLIDLMRQGYLYAYHLNIVIQWHTAFVDFVCVSCYLYRYNGDLYYDLCHLLIFAGMVVF